MCFSFLWLYKLAYIILILLIDGSFVDSDIPSQDIYI